MDIHKWIIRILVVIFSTSSIAQTRFLDDTYFDSIQVDTAILFGNNNTLLGENQNLYLDFYQPYGDTLQERPLIIWIHGGGYSSGTRTDSHIQRWCNEFARRGYVTASIDYRLGLSGSNNGKLEAIYRSVQDAKAAIRYFRMNAELYDIDIDKIVIAGSSVGSFTALHTAYWDTDEIPSEIDTVILGNLEGNSGNLGYPSNPNAVINFWGAIKDSTWIDEDEPMIVSCAGIEDSVVYPESYTWPSGNEYGSIVIDRVAKSKNIPDTLRLFFGAKHTLAGGSGADQVERWDTATAFVTEFLYCNLITTCDILETGEITTKKFSKLIIYPNPSTNVVTIQLEQDISNQPYQITDQFGRLISKDLILNNKTVISIDHLAPGIYFLQLMNSQFEIIRFIKS